MFNVNVPTINDLMRFGSYREMVSFINALQPMQAEAMMFEHIKEKPTKKTGTHTAFVDKKPIEHSVDVYTKVISKKDFEIEINTSFCFKCSNTITLTVIGYEHRLGESYVWQIKSRGKYI